MKIIVQRDSDVPLYRQVAEQIRQFVRSGAVPPGHRLPPVRKVADDLGITRLTVHAAYAELQAQGLLESFVGRGTFVTARVKTTAAVPEIAPQPALPWLSQGSLTELTRIRERPEQLSFATAVPAPESYPSRELARFLRAALDDPSSLGYGAIEGDNTLREQICNLLLDRGIATQPDQVMVVSGVQQGIDVALRALTKPEDVILVEEPTYPGAIEIAAQRGQRVVGIPLDENGLSITALEAACQAHRPRLLYTIPTFHNPTGVSLSPERRAALLEVAHAYDLLVVEDDIYGLLALEGSAPPPLKSADADGRVVYTTSFSKILSPGLRLGAIVASPTLLPALAAAKQSSDLLSSPLLQRALAEYLRHGYLIPHLERVTKIYRQRRDAMLTALERFLSQCRTTSPKGGLSIWVALPVGVDERSFWLDAMEHGIGVARGQAFFPQPERSAFIRLCFGAHPPGQIERATSILGGILADHLHRRDEAAVRADRDGSPLV